jgi:hypothetical protein
MNGASEATEEERCSCGGVIVFDDENGIAHCYSCQSHESYTTPALRERALKPKTAPQRTDPEWFDHDLRERLTNHTKYGF